MVESTMIGIDLKDLNLAQKADIRKPKPAYRREASRHIENIRSVESIISNA
jgi:hypothetical protein